MNLDQLMAFTVSDDHPAQKAGWFGQPAYNRHPTTIRRVLTETQVEADDPDPAVFVGIEASGRRGRRQSQFVPARA